ncbi:MAG: hypothetical protein A2504_11835 [Bdellovibrionales bacterium RIFOXYD12_FULL_39_22]|nr:MAG: hypothetical protein A2385_16350 [Bdellovibrionales bacterium RIFOXYB1_FULL_39_21]OFZ44472.1 MAG: hypothetical protein A2485_06545 [Bdellovibrionales bacterium RIFOXYC12_FULL_39_17]OFZ49886.1 MAG: hypothetical protein A2404_00920 [Bdellovibrionales bacterium RIFOXYC1_FULL_39_130]OFZ76891.1 MAG: hypothetical protein A2560_05720 [Bdellovibrionales bacterium RIFOXYD1_FULL_39_84]OFZ95818.1 MAG: hypothetical protein A2504_11835 [Bdellovibrionales bacterium RIFOXYD12_FULL_39_22]HLE10838.1 gl
MSENGKNSARHILILPSWYKNTYGENSGSFVREQAKAISAHGFKIGVIHNSMALLSYIAKFRKIPRLKQMCFEDDGIYTCLGETLQIPTLRGTRIAIIGSIISTINKIVSFVNATRNRWAWLKLFEKYVAVNGPPDLLHVHSVYPSDVPITIARRYKIPYVVTEHWSGFADARVDQRRDWIRNIYSAPSAVISVSTALQRLLMDRCGVRSTVIPNCIDFNKFTPTARKEKNFSFLAVGYFNKIKRYDLLIAAFNKAFKNDPSVELRIIGDGYLMDDLKKMATDCGANITFLGGMGRSEVATNIATSHVLVSTSDFETFGVTLIEALASGVPVIATKSGGPEDIVTREQYGHLCDSSIDSIAKTMVDAKNNYGKFVSKEIRELAFNDFSEEAVVPRIIDIYTNVVKNHGRP